MIVRNVAPNLLCVILLLYRGNGSTTIVNNLFYRHSVQNETGLAFLFQGFRSMAAMF